MGKEEESCPGQQVGEVLSSQQWGKMELADRARDTEQVVCDHHVSRGAFLHHAGINGDCGRGCLLSLGVGCAWLERHHVAWKSCSYTRRVLVTGCRC